MDVSVKCVTFKVVRCKYSVGGEHQIAEVARLFGTDWLQVSLPPFLPSSLPSSLPPSLPLSRFPCSLFLSVAVAVAVVAAVTASVHVRVLSL